MRTRHGAPSRPFGKIKRLDKNLVRRLLIKDVVVSVGMLARKTTRFRRRGVGAEGNSGATEPSSQRKRLANAMQVSRDERERRRATSGGERASSADEASVGHGEVERARL